MKKSPKQYWKLGRSEYATQFFDINKNGELLVKEGNYQYNVHELAKKYDTSLELVFPFIIEHRVEELIISSIITSSIIITRAGFIFIIQ
ncbi:MAG: hypothetical protein WC618_02835 [Patescibacteria group bacterium]